MRRLILLRHAKAARLAGGGDKERPLTARGREDARRMGEYLLSEGLVPHLAVASDSRRTRQTLEGVVAAMGRSFKSIHDPALYLAEDAALMAEFHKTPDVVGALLVVGHNPGVHEFALRMAGGGDLGARARMELKFPTSGLAVLDFAAESWAAVGWGEGRLDRFVTPATLDDEPGAAV